MRTLLLITAAALIAGLVACGDGGTQGPAAPTFLGPTTSLQITGSLAFTAIGQTRQLTASATFRNGVVRNVSNDAAWTSTNPAVATVDRGLVRIVGLGDTQISVTFRSVSSAAAAVSVRANPVATSIAITGPAEIAPGSTTQFTAIVSFADGTTSDVTATANWVTLTSNLRHAGGGRFEALTGGDGFVAVNASGRSTSKAVIVVPTGTFRLSGTVTDASGSLSGVLVEVVSGTGAGLTTKSQQGGEYGLFGVAGQVQVRASAPGFVTQEFTLTVNSHTRRNIGITANGTTLDVSGQWTLTISTSGSCSESWSPETRRRQVPTRITQSGTRLTIRFENVAQWIFDTTGRVAAEFFSMSLFYDDYYLDWGLMQRVTPTEWIGVNGEFSGQVSGGLIEGTFDGFFHNYQTTANASGPGPNPRRCAADPRFELRR